MTTIKWTDIFIRVKKIKDKYSKETKYWGIPRGGQVAQDRDWETLILILY